MRHSVPTNGRAGPTCASIGAKAYQFVDFTHATGQLPGSPATPIVSPAAREEEVSDGPFAADWAWRVGLASAAAGQVAVTRVETETGFAGMDKTTQTEDVRFKNEFYERMTVPVSVQGTGPYRFLVDTGADRTAVSRDLVIG